jgi:hypothetical protein
LEISNKTKRPIKVPLPGGKTLFLGPSGKGKIVPKAAEHPPLKALIDSGDLEIVFGGHSKSKGSGGGNASPGGSQNDGGSGSLRHTGDR